MVKTDNIFELIVLLKEEPRSADWISSKLNISLPTVYRYIKSLRKKGYEIKFTSKKYHLLSDSFTTDGEYKEIVKKKEIFVPEKYKKKIKHAIDFSLPITIVYKKPSSDHDKDYTLYPHDLIFLQDRYYLLAKDKNDGVTKEFRLDRIKEINVNNSIKKVMNKPFEIKFKVSEKMIGYYEDFFDSTEIINETSTERIVKANIHSLFRAKQLLIPYMEHIEIIEPKELREDMVGTLKKMLNMYENK